MSLQLPTQFDSTLGIEFVGGVVATALYGLATSQAVVFFLTFPHESTIVKCSVGFVWAAATIHTLFVAHGLYTSMVSQFTQAVAAILVPWSYWVGFAVGVTGDTIVRLFFAYRLWKLSRQNTLVVYPSVIITIVYWLMSIGLVILGFIKIRDFFGLRHESWIIYSTLSLISFVDIWFAIWLSYYIKNARLLNKFCEPASFMKILGTIFVYTVNTGFLTGLFSVLSLIMFAALPNNTLWLGFFFLVGKLYTNAMFATLNVRTWSHAGIDDSKVPVVTVNGNPTIPVAFTDAPPPELQVHIEKEVVEGV